MIPKITRGLGSIRASEILILEALCAGMTDPEIAKHLGINLSTVKSHLKNIALRLGVGRYLTLRIPLAVAWSEYKRQYKDCELFHIGLAETRLRIQ